MMKTETFMEKVHFSKNIYSFIVELYCFLSKEKEQLWKKAYKSFCNNKTDVLKRIRAITDTIPYATGNDFSPWIKGWASVFQNNIADYTSIIFQTLSNFGYLLKFLNTAFDMAVIRRFTKDNFASSMFDMFRLDEEKINFTWNLFEENKSTLTTIALLNSIVSIRKINTNIEIIKDCLLGLIDE